MIDLRCEACFGDPTCRECFGEESTGRRHFDVRTRRWLCAGCIALSRAGELVLRNDNTPEPITP